MDYEEKYNKALERVRDLMTNQNPPAFDKHLIETVFPELKESEDERMWKLIKKYAHYNISDVVLDADHITREYLESWLEKQGEQTHAEPEQSEVTSEQELESKFHPGDWIIDNEYGDVLKVTKADANSYEITRQDGEIFDILKEDVECNHRLWSIEDAKDGDLIYVSTEEKGIQAIFHEYKNATIFFHCYLCADFVQGGYMPIGSVELTYPLQKTHYNRFFEKMHEAGYEWDGKKKELKKIEHKMFNPDKVVEWLNDQACQGWIEDVEVDKFVDKFKKDFGL